MSMYVSFDIDEKCNYTGTLVFGYVYRGVEKKRQILSFGL